VQDHALDQSSADFRRIYNGFDRSLIESKFNGTATMYRKFLI